MAKQVRCVPWPIPDHSTRNHAHAVPSIPTAHVGEFVPRKKGGRNSGDGGGGGGGGGPVSSGGATLGDLPGQLLEEVAEVRCLSADDAGKAGGPAAEAAGGGSEAAAVRAVRTAVATSMPLVLRVRALIRTPGASSLPTLAERLDD